MKQYTYLSEGQSFYIPDASGIKTRWTVRGGLICNDAELYVGGFADAENTGWRELQGEERTVVSRARVGNRGGWKIDIGLTVLEFAGAESTDDGVTGDWMNLE